MQCDSVVQVPLVPVVPGPEAGLAIGSHKSGSQQRRAIKQAVQHFGALGKAVDTLVEAQVIAN